VTRGIRILAIIVILAIVGELVLSVCLAASSQR
jgi:hypothetical protein